MNNKFVPLGADKLAREEIEELNLFSEVQKELNDADSSIPHTAIQAESREQAKRNYMNYKVSRLFGNLKVKITNEEEKYVYLLRKLHDYPRLNEFFPSLVLERLRTALLSSDFNDAYNYRLARLICFICREHKNYEFINGLILDLIALKDSALTDYFHEIVLLFIRIWSEVLNYPSPSLIFLRERSSSSQRKCNPILCMIVDIVRRKFADHYNRVLLGTRGPSRNFDAGLVEARLKYAFYVSCLEPLS